MSGHSTHSGQDTHWGHFSCRASDLCLSSLMPLHTPLCCRTHFSVPFHATSHTPSFLSTAYTHTHSPRVTGSSISLFEHDTHLHGGREPHCSLEDLLCLSPHTHIFSVHTFPLCTPPHTHTTTHMTSHLTGSWVGGGEDIISLPAHTGILPHFTHTHCLWHNLSHGGPKCCGISTPLCYLPFTHLPVDSNRLALHTSTAPHTLLFAHFWEMFTPLRTALHDHHTLSISLLSQWLHLPRADHGGRHYLSLIPSPHLRASPLTHTQSWVGHITTRGHTVHGFSWNIGADLQGLVPLCLRPPPVTSHTSHGRWACLDPTTLSAMGCLTHTTPHSSPHVWRLTGQELLHTPLLVHLCHTTHVSCHFVHTTCSSDTGGLGTLHSPITHLHEPLLSLPSIITCLLITCLTWELTRLEVFTHTFSHHLFLHFTPAGGGAMHWASLYLALPHQPQITPFTLPPGRLSSLSHLHFLYHLSHMGATHTRAWPSHHIRLPVTLPLLHVALVISTRLALPFSTPRTTHSYCCIHQHSRTSLFCCTPHC